MTGLTPRSLLLAVVVTFIWGANFVVIHHSVAEAPPLLVVALRFLLAAFPAILLVPRPNMPWRFLVLYGLAGGVAQFGLMYLAVKLGLGAGLASLLMQSQAFFTALLAAWVLHEQIRPHQWAGMALAFTGMAAIGLAGTHEANGLGLLLIVGSALGWASANILVRVVGPVNVLSLGVWSSLVPPLPLLALAVLTSGLDTVRDAVLQATPGLWGAVAYMAFLNTLFGFGAWNLLIQRHGAARVAPLSLLVPVFGLAVAAALLGERLTAGQALGALLVFGGLTLHVFGLRWPPSRLSRSQPGAP